MSTATVEKGSARERLLAAANELFYDEGVNSVGIDRVIERAGVAKASLYSTFGSKEELIRAYLLGRHEERIARYQRGLAKYATPREKLLGVFDVLGQSFKRPNFHGCAFVNASAEAPSGGAIEAVSDMTREWIRAMFRQLATEAGAREPAALARQLAMVYDGAVITARMDRTAAAGATAKAIAQTLIEAGVPS
jgi:AcrR family transcriptional regulator